MRVNEHLRDPSNFRLSTAFESIAVATTIALSVCGVGGMAYLLLLLVMQAMQ